MYSFYFLILKDMKTIKLTPTKMPIPKKSDTKMIPATKKNYWSKK